jgi:hypothetical protein
VRADAHESESEVRCMERMTVVKRQPDSVLAVPCRALRRQELVIFIFIQSFPTRLPPANNRRHAAIDNVRPSFDCCDSNEADESRTCQVTAHVEKAAVIGQNLR